ncbi:cyclic AMP receptor-like protein [Acrasis kona]|uniref:Cyclic AMP receptor-like protein n=1 Tax=Acrasis kona TaxID=1008807 RepID=A0AAW2ZN16_9EUKA
MLDVRLNFIITYIVLAALCIGIGITIKYSTHKIHPKRSLQHNNTIPRTFDVHTSGDNIDYEQHFYEDSVIMIITMVTSILSAICSVVVILHFVLGIKQFARSLQTKLIVYWCCADVIRNLSFAIGSPFHLNDSVCMTQGILVQFSSLSQIMWSLCVAFALLEANAYRRTPKELKKCLPYFHFVSWVVPLATALLAFHFDEYGNAGGWCWIYSSRSSSATFIAIAQVFVVKHLRAYLATRALTFNVQNIESITKDVSLKLRMFLVSFLMTYTFALLRRSLNLFHVSPPFVIIVIHALTIGLSGFFNFCAYFISTRGRVFDWIFVLFNCCLSKPELEVIDTSVSVASPINDQSTELSMSPKSNRISKLLDTSNVSSIAEYVLGDHQPVPTEQTKLIADESQNTNLETKKEKRRDKRCVLIESLFTMAIIIICVFGIILLCMYSLFHPENNIPHNSFLIIYKTKTYSSTYTMVSRYNSHDKHLGTGSYISRRDNKKKMPDHSLYAFHLLKNKLYYAEDLSSSHIYDIDASFGAIKQIKSPSVNYEGSVMFHLMVDAYSNESNLYSLMSIPDSAVPYERKIGLHKITTNGSKLIFTFRFEIQDLKSYPISTLNNAFICFYFRLNGESYDALYILRNNDQSAQLSKVYHQDPDLVRYALQYDPESDRLFSVGRSSNGTLLVESGSVDYIEFEFDWETEFYLNDANVDSDVFQALFVFDVENSRRKLLILFVDNTILSVDLVLKQVIVMDRPSVYVEVLSSFDN